MKVKKKILILILVGLLVFSWAAARETEEEYPFEGPTTTTMTLEDYIGYVYQFLVIISGLIAFGVLLFGGFKYLTAGGNTEALKSARNYMLGAVTGLVLVLGSYLILKIINPNIFKPPEIIKPPDGVCFYSQSDAKGRQICYSKSQKSFPENFQARSVEFESFRSELDGISIFKEENWENGRSYIKNERDENKDKPDTPPDEPDVHNANLSMFDIRSFYMHWERPGIYLYRHDYLEEDFPNEPYQFYQTQVSDIEEYRDKVKSVKFINKGCKKDEKGNYYPEIGYSAIFHSRTNYKGECSIVFGTEPTTIGLPDVEDYCTWRRINDLTREPPEDNTYYIHPIGTSTRSITPFNYSFKTNEEGQVTFYEREDFRGDHFTLTASEIGDYWSTTTLSYPISTSTSNLDVEKGDIATDDARLSKIHSYKIEGKFMVVLTQGKELESRCQVSEQSNPELSDDYVTGLVASEEPGKLWQDSRIHSIAIIPTQGTLRQY